MMDKIKILLATLLVGIFGITAVSPPALAKANVIDPICRDNPNATVCLENQATRDSNRIFGPDSVLMRVAQLLLLVVGIAAVVMIIIGGLKYVLATGDATKINSAKNTILYALIGLVVAAIAQALILFVINKVL